ncbi:uncharacterized protein LOC113305821 [Papaver somniferum]|uniref:uncharacterized protein LOC113305821 n=1 Tax=Papaver somniferum TaxID=3469 RepID=UPI000E705AA0|nr:uncharacterized protein LOC113305821 [Papaver somniferum]
MRYIWFQRNDVLFEDGKINMNNFKRKIHQMVHEGDGYILFYCDGVSFGNPGNAGFGVVARDNISQVIGTLSGGVGIATNSIAEIYVILCALEWAVVLMVKKVIIRSDYKSVVSPFEKNKVPWYLRIRWQNVIQLFDDVKFQHCYREINFSADLLAKKASSTLPVIPFTVLQPLKLPAKS